MLYSQADLLAKKLTRDTGRRWDIGCEPSKHGVWYITDGEKKYHTITEWRDDSRGVSEMGMTEQQHGATTCNVCGGYGKIQAFDFSQDEYRDKACPACEGTGSIEIPALLPSEYTMRLITGTLTIMERLFVLLQDCMLDEATDLLNKGITDTRAALLAPVTTEAL